MAGGLRIRQAILANHVSLLFAWLQTTYGYVEPPTNVTFHCHNLHERLQWSYDQLVPGLRFRVEIRSEQRLPLEVWVDPPALHANISFLTDPFEDNMLTVTAVVGKNKSEAVPAGGIVFSYFRETLEHKCSVDFPPVAVNVNPDGHVLFHFKHPWLVYGSSLSQAKPRKRKSNEENMLRRKPEFTYTVKVNQHLEETDRCYTNVCEGKLPVDPGQDRQCLGVWGEMQMLVVEGSQEYCSSPFTPVLQEQNKDVYVTAGALTTVAVIALAVVVFIVYKKKTNASEFSPTATMITSRRKPGTLNLPRDQVSVPQVGSPAPLLTDEFESENVTPARPSTEPEHRFRLGVDVKVAEEGCDEGSEYMRGSELEAAPVNGSGYEQRPVVRVELAPGDPAEGYRQGGL